ncbi:MAG: arylsulfatase A-like enzyme [Planctomycetota bacterium]|jgi:arylsulfatase A-like enzyme
MDHTNLGDYGRPTTPFLAKLVADGATSLPHVRAAAPWTKPSVASLFTGLAPGAHGVLEHPDRLHSAHRTLAEAYQAGGYQTAGFQTNVLLSSVFGYDQGFDTYNEDHLATHEHSTGAALNTAVATWLDDDLDGDEPFFLYVHHFEPHFEYLRSGEEWGGSYDGRLTGAEKMDQLIAVTDQMEAPDVEFLVDRYDAEVRYQDQLLAELWASFGERGLQENTILVVTSDHGEEFKDHGQLSHQYTLFDELVRVPLVVLAPNLEPYSPIGHYQSLSNQSLSNLGASLLDWSELEHDFPGANFDETPGDPAVVSSSVCWNADGEKGLRHSIVTRGFKLIRTEGFGADEATLELYHLRSDKPELMDLVPTIPQFAESLNRELTEALAKQAALGPIGLEPESFTPTEETLKRMAELGYL